MIRAWLTLGMGIALLAVGHAGAQSPALPSSNPRVGIRLEAATCAEAVTALERATGIALRLDPRTYPAERQAEADRQLRERVRFDWTTVPLGTALDQLVERYRLNVHTAQAGQLSLYPSYEPETVGPFRPASQIEVGGYRIGVVQTHVTRKISDRRNEGDLNVSLRVEPLHGDVEALAGTAAVSAVDDVGTALTTEDSRLDGRAGTTLPGRWTTSFSFPAPAPHARRLTTLRGKLVAYRKVTRHRAEFALPLSPMGRYWREGDIAIEDVQYKPGPIPPPENYPERLGGGPSITAGFRVPQDFVEAPEFFSPYGGGRYPAPLLVGASGKTYSPSLMQTRPGTERVHIDGQPRTLYWVWTFPVIEEPLLRIVFNIVHKEDPEPVLSFQLKDVPLPQAGPARSQLPAELTPARLEPGHPLFHKGGGRLVSPVQIGGRPAPAGSLYLGLSPCTPRTARGSEWFEATIAPTAPARLSDLAPGTYRVLRIYRPREAATLPTGGVWRSAETIIEVPAGGEVALPPLSWHENAAPTPRELKDRAHPVEPTPGEEDENRIELREAHFSLSQNYLLYFLRRPLAQDRSSASVTIAGATGANHSARMLNLRNIVARDDRGHLLVSSGASLNQTNRLWYSTLGIPGLSPQAARLDWIEGDVVAYTRVQPVRIEIPVTAQKQTVKRTAEGVSVELTLTPGDSDDTLQKPGENRTRRGLRIEGRIQAPTSVDFKGLKGEFTLEPVLVAASGTVHKRGPHRDPTQISGSGPTRTLEGEFPALDEPASHVLLEFIVKSEPRKVGAFRATNVAILRPPAVAPAVAPAQPPAAPNAESRPIGAPAPLVYLDPRGGNLIQQVRLAGRPAPAGTLSLGFIREDTPGAQTIRWVEARVDPEGTARVDGLKPGIYRIQSKYRPPAEAPLTGPGRWLNVQNRIRIHPGKATLLPPAEWRPTPP